MKMPSPYLPLDPERKQIRILHIQPGVEQDAVACDMATVSLLDDPEYDALSYAWEGQSPSVPVTINGCVLAATATLATALRRLRREDAGVRLWADGICINQGDVRERGQQVGMMLDVYRKAGLVRVWLGDLRSTWCGEMEAFLQDQGWPDFELVGIEGLDDEGHEAGDGPRKLAVCRSLRDASDLSSLLGLMQAFGLSDLPDDVSLFVRRSDALFGLAPRWRGALLQLLWIMCRPWWPRLWIIQEVALATRDPVVHVGNHHLSFCELVWTLRAFQDQCDAHAAVSHPSSRYFHGTLYNLGSPANSLYLRRLRVLEGSLEPPETLSETSCLHEATNPCDHYYGMLGLIQNTDQTSVSVDYTLDAEQVFVKATKTIITQNGDLSHLYFATQINREEDKSTIPSWCIDWQHGPPSNVSEGLHHRCLEHVKHPINIGEYHIEINAALLGNITETVPIPLFPVTDDKVHDYVRRCAALAQRLGLSNTDPRLASALFPDLLSSVGQSGVWESDDAAATILEWCRSVVEQPLSRTPQDLSEEAGELARIIRSSLEMPPAWADRVFATSKGMLGHHTAQVELGDCVASIAGCHHAVVLRPIAEEVAEEEDTGLPAAFCFAGFCHLQDFNVNTAHELLDDPEAWTRIVLR